MSDVIDNGQDSFCISKQLVCDCHSAQLRSSAWFGHLDYATESPDDWKNPDVWDPPTEILFLLIWGGEWFFLQDPSVVAMCSQS